MRVLQEKRFRPIGANEEVSADFRVISASNKDLKTLVDKGPLSADEYKWIIEILATVGADFDPYAEWLDPNPLPPDRLQQLTAPHPAGGMEAYPVSTHVNRPGNDDAECITRVNPPI